MIKKQKMTDTEHLTLAREAIKKRKEMLEAKKQSHMVHQITEPQFALLKKYTSMLFSRGMGDNDFTANTAKLVSLSEKENGWDSTGTAHMEFMYLGNIEQEEFSVSTLFSKIEEFKYKNGDFDAEYNQFLLDLDVEISRCQNVLAKLETPETSEHYKYKNKSFIAGRKVSNKRTIKYINKLKISLNND